MMLFSHRYGKPVPGSASDIRGQKYQKAVNDEVEENNSTFMSYVAKKEERKNHMDEELTALILQFWK